MRFDMHCHTREGSLDGKISLTEYATLMKDKGYHGMLITDHDSYNGYRYYKRHESHPAFRDFVVLKGIEYDTIDAGHILVIMPEYIRLPILELRGLPVKKLIEIVHFFGGILGPAHPCGVKYLSFCNTRRYRRDPDILKKFDFMETFNSCEPPEANAEAGRLARKYDLTGFGGTDAHKGVCVGYAYTEFPEDILTETDLIRYVKAKRPITCGGFYFHGTTRERIGSFNNILVQGFWFYNKAAGIYRYYKRRIAMADYKRRIAAAEHLRGAKKA